MACGGGAGREGTWLPHFSPGSNPSGGLAAHPVLRFKDNRLCPVFFSLWLARVSSLQSKTRIQFPLAEPHPFSKDCGLKGDSRGVWGLGPQPPSVLSSPTSPGTSASAPAGNTQHAENGKSKNYLGTLLFLETWGQGQREPRRKVKHAGLMPVTATRLPGLRSETRATPLLLSLSCLLPPLPLAELNGQPEG